MDTRGPTAAPLLRVARDGVVDEHAAYRLRRDREQVRAIGPDDLVDSPSLT